MRGGPRHLAVLVVALVVVALRGHVVRGVHGLAVRGAVVGLAAMRHVRGEDEKLACRGALATVLARVPQARGLLTGFQLDRRPLLLCHPLVGDAVGLGVDGHVHLVAGVDHLEPAVGHVGRVHAQQNRQVLDVLDVLVRDGVNVRREAAAAGQLVVDLFLEEMHGLAGQRLEEAEELGAAQEAVEARVAVRKVFCAAEHALALGVYFLEMPVSNRDDCTAFCGMSLFFVPRRA